MQKIISFGLIAALSLSACNDNGLGVNITLKSKDKDTGSSQAISLDVDGKDVKVKTVASDVRHLEDGKKVTVTSEDSVTVNSPDTANEQPKKIPESFKGKWVGFQIGDKETIQEWQAKDICSWSYSNNYQDRSWIKIIDADKQIIRNVFFYEDSIDEQVLNYQIYSSGRIKGSAKYIENELGEDKPRSVWTGKFEYFLENGILYDITSDSNNRPVKTKFFRCSES